jgi:hypothetical protein
MRFWRKVSRPRRDASGDMRPIWSSIMSLGMGGPGKKLPLLVR